VPILKFFFAFDTRKKRLDIKRSCVKVFKILVAVGVIIEKHLFHSIVIFVTFFLAFYHFFLFLPDTI